MKKTIYLLILLFSLAGCKKQQVDERMTITRVSFINKTQLESGLTIRFENKNYNTLDQIGTAYGDNKVEILDGAGKKVIDTVLNIKGPQEFYIYQPFDIVPPVIVTTLPDKPPVDPRNPLKNETPAPAGYVKIKVAFQTQFILPGQDVELIVLSTTAASSDVAVPIASLHHVNVNYNIDMFQIKRPLLSDGTLSQTFSFSLIDPATGERIKTGNGSDYKSAALTLPLGENNLFMFYFKDQQNASRFAPTSIPVNGLPYIILPNLLWSIE